jgi:sarcosine oxidase, subunit alpha
VDRADAVRFTFDGKLYAGLRGDTLASALLANGVHLVGRSFKYRRPRGILCAGSDEPNALVTVRRGRSRYTPNLRATQVEIYDGLRAESQNRWPSLRFDAGALRGCLARLTPAGFYYKTFMWPRSAWKALYEPLLRSAAGLGRAPSDPDPDRYSHRYVHCDVLVVGAGPAGLAGALAASAAGARVTICDEQPQLGGSLLSCSEVCVDGIPARRWIARALESLSANPRVTLLPRTTAFGYFPHNLIGLNERLSDHLSDPDVERPRERLWEVRAREVLLATGALERPLVFPGNDRPGVMLAGAARTYLNRFGVLVGRRAVVVASCDAAYEAALDLLHAGVEIAAIADTRAAVEGSLPQAARQAGVPIFPASTVLGTRGRLRVTAIQLGRVSDTGNVDPDVRLACDTVLMSGGLTPSVHLFSQSRGALEWSESVGAFVPGTAAERVRSAGACRGTYSLEDAVAEGSREGAAAADDSTSARPHSSGTGVPISRHSAGFAGALPQPEGARAGPAFVDWQNDVIVEDLDLAVREGFRSVEHLKRYTTTGMATDQGKTSNLNALGILAKALRRPIPEVGLTTFRMPFTPVTFGSLAGFSRRELFDPVRTTPLHSWAAQHGAVFENAGQWKRTLFFGRAGESLHEAVARECQAVRSGCGLFDASTLGKVEVVGPDAAIFLSRMYVNDLTRLGVGRCRYALLLRDDGFIFDDGVIARIDEQRFHVTTTTGGAARVLAMMEDYLQTEWPDLRVWLTSTTEQWAVMALQGPAARGALRELVTGCDISSVALPHMSVVEGRICGIPMRLFRVSFTGELGFEINVPADYGRPVWEAVLAAGKSYGITCYGTETMHVLRAEKGYLIVGQDTDGTVTPEDAGLSWTIGRNKADFIGKRSLRRPALTATGRKQLVGLVASDPGLVLEEGAQLTLSADERPPVRTLGHVTSAYLSSVLGYGIALAMIKEGRSRMGETLYALMGQKAVPVRVSSPVFYDAEGARVHA